MEVSEVIEVIRAVDEKTSDPVASGRGLWAIVLPAVKARITEFLHEEAFRELLLELPALNLALLAMLDTNNVQSPDLLRVSMSPRTMFQVLGDSDDEDVGHLRDPRYGQGRRLE